ncbi:MAG: hypothetical protein KJP04_01400, partial [Arenicella sp.]|nr:hypothetical protein [Arenicella sp.]
EVKRLAKLADKAAEKAAETQKKAAKAQKSADKAKEQAKIARQRAKAVGVDLPEEETEPGEKAAKDKDADNHNEPEN